MFFFKNKNSNSSFTLTLRQKLRVNRVSSFTLIELLIVIGILAVLMVAVVIAINPAEYLRESRDSKRLTDLSSLHNALQTLEALSASALSLGTPLTVYISIADEASSTCGSLGLPALPTGYSYSCVTSANLKNTDGTGWIPVNFQDASGVIQISALPIDPVNSTTTSNYYTYIPGGSYELSTIFESTKYRLSGDKDKVSIDGGDNYSMYEVGSNLTLNPLKDTGLVGWWKFDEGTGTSASDSSGSGNTGTLTNGPTWTSGKVGGGLSFDAIDDNVGCGGSSLFNITDQITISGWFKQSSINQSYNTFLQKGGGFSQLLAFRALDGVALWYINGLSNWVIGAYLELKSGADWAYVTLTYNKDGGTGNRRFYLNGVLRASTTNTGSMPIAVSNLNIGIRYDTPANYSIDDVRIYNRALSASEIMNLYNATR